MASVVVVGAQWGDEGKGKVVDLYTEFAEIVVRFSGGNNAGHTVVVGNEKTVLHLIPSGALHRGKRCVIGSGVVVDPEVLFGEIEMLKLRGYLSDPSDLLLSPLAHVILPTHRRLDAAREKRAGNAKIGTTGRGIGPCYEDKAARIGIRVADLIAPLRLREKVKDVVEAHNGELKRLKAETVKLADIEDKYVRLGAALAPHVTNTSVFLNDAIGRGKSVLFEGSQGTLLDLDHGTYPFVTSTSTIAGGACTGAGVGPTRIDSVVGISKAYSTRVGSGPFPTELDDDLGKKLREVGGEFGATTGRPRRCGWLDLVAIRHAVRLNGLSSIALTKLDVLEGIPKLRLCVAYEIDGKTVDELPTDAEALARVTPVYEDMDGWDATSGRTIREVRAMDDLPIAAKRFVLRVQQLAGVDVSLISVGPARTETMVLKNPFRSR
ncbi:MAG: adenylosuccinate synthase [Deltaproteobacteria bacterium]|nr:adenylosuccinate synthase [Deltaproteobacteria bacterium]